MRVTRQMLLQALEDTALVQSFSGVRSSFGSGPEISGPHEALVTAYAYAYARKTLGKEVEPILLLGRDPRPTGEEVIAALARGYAAGALSLGVSVSVVNLGIITTPLMQTAVRSLSAAGGAMVTASHNPIEDNGFKFLTGCLSDESLPSCSEAPPGALLSAQTMAEVVQSVAKLAQYEDEAFDRALKEAANSDCLRDFQNGEDGHLRVQAERAYLDEISAQWRIESLCLKPLVLGPALLDPNGGAACGIGARVLEHFGVRTIEVNAELGQPKHAIDTDGIEPETGSHMLLQTAMAAYRENARFGVAFDYDADRGNLVLPGFDESAIVHPQRLSAANIALALAHRELMDHQNRKLAVVMADTTSGASVDVASYFGAEVFIVETGEVNVVTKMHCLRREGYDVPVGVEGANGGTIFGMSTCRDGLQTAFCAAIADEKPELGRCVARNLKIAPDKQTFDLRKILSAVPNYYNQMLRVQGPTRPHAEIKSCMEELFVSSVWPKISHWYRSYKFVNYEGTGLVERRTGDESGGWRILLEADGTADFIFARGSRTEAGLWRIITDSKDSTRAEVLQRASLFLFSEAAGGEAVVL